MASASDTPVAYIGASSETELSESSIPSPDDSELAEYMSLAKQLRTLLHPIKPSAAFVDALDHKLRQAAIEPSVEVLPSQRMSWVVGAAAVGSVLSLLGLFHLLRGSHHAIGKAS